MQDIMSTNVAPRNNRDDPDSQLGEQKLEETKLLEIWKELVRQLASSTTSAKQENVRRAVPRGFNNIANSDPRESDDHYLIWRSHSARNDYAAGASLAFNPFAIFHASYTCKSDFVALAGDWEEIRDDMFDAWTALVRDDPVVKRLVEKSLEEERATYDEPAT
jgi:hypothetical protein